MNVYNMQHAEPLFLILETLFNLPQNGILLCVFRYYKSSAASLVPPIQRCAASLVPPIQRCAASLVPPIQRCAASLVPPIQRCPASLVPPIRQLFRQKFYYPAT